MSTHRKSGVRPEEISADGGDYYNADEAHRYDSLQTTNVIQIEMTNKALDLLAIQNEHQSNTASYVIADIGCGSGLSGLALYNRNLAWLGVDVSRPMLHLAQQSKQKTCKGHVALADMSQGLPFRSNSLHFAVSISAVQWLCVRADPHSAALRFFRDVWRCLENNGRAAFQVYLKNNHEHVKLLLEAARSVGFEASYSVDFPHSTPAKKFFILLAKRPTHQNDTIISNRKRKSKDCISAASPDVCTDINAVNCPLCWPGIGACTLPWINQYAEMNSNIGESPGIKRMYDEHSIFSRRTVRMLLHAVSCSPTSKTYANNDTKNITSSAGCFVDEYFIRDDGLMPCGGPCMVQISSPCDGYAVCETEIEGLKVGSVHVLLELLFGKKPTVVRHTRRQNEADQLNESQWSERIKNFFFDLGDRENPATTKSKFIYLEPIPDNETSAILHATKPASPEMLVLSSSFSSPTEVATATLPLLMKIAGENNGCVVGVDIVVRNYHLKNDACTDEDAGEETWCGTCAWLLYIPDIQHRDRQTLRTLTLVPP